MHGNVNPTQARGLPTTELRAAAELLRALSSPVRLAIVLELRTGARCVHELVETLGATQPLVSQHLRVLRGAGLVAAERRGREVAYALADQHVAHIATDAVRHAAEVDQPAGSDPVAPVPPAGPPARTARKEGMP